MSELKPENLLELVKIELKQMKVAIPEDFHIHTLFVDHMGMDSMTLGELVARIEYKFRIVVGDDEWDSLSSVNTMSAFLEQRVA